MHLSLTLRYTSNAYKSTRESVKVLNISSSSAARSASAENETLEGSPELRVEDRVDHRVHEGVHVADPRRVEERAEADLAVRVLEHDAEGVDDVDAEEGHPAHEERA